MPAPKIPRSELQILQRLWEMGPASIREIHESLAEANRPAYTTVQTLVNRLEQKGAVGRIKKIGSAHVYQATYTKRRVYQRLIDDLLDLFDGSAPSMVSHLIDAGKLSLEDLKHAEDRLKGLKKLP